MPEEEQTTAEELALLLQAAQPVLEGDDPVAEVSAYEFPVTLRGYDRTAVDAYVARVTEIVGALESTRSPEAAIRLALERVGGEVADILKRAHATAADISARSHADAESRLHEARADAASTLAGARTESERMLGDARAEAERLVRDAESEAEGRRQAGRRALAELEAEGQRRSRELDADADRLWTERQRIVEEVRDLAGRLESLADSVTESWGGEEDTGTGEVVVLSEEDDDTSTQETTVMPAATQEATVMPAALEGDPPGGPAPMRAVPMRPAQPGESSLPPEPEEEEPDSPTGGHPADPDATVAFEVPTEPQPGP